MRVASLCICYSAIVNQYRTKAAKPPLMREKRCTEIDLYASAIAPSVTSTRRQGGGAAIDASKRRCA